MWGYHLTVDCAGCNESIKNQETLRQFADEMVRTLGMRAYGTPVIVRFGDDPKVSGYTLVQLIETSDITGHFCDYTSEAYIDIFSCNQFSQQDAIAVIERFFLPKNYITNFTTRQAPSSLGLVGAQASPSRMTA